MKPAGSAAPIGIFDSGAGGLSVLKAVVKRMPEENLIYFGDTANLPYGSKSKAAVRRASASAARFLAGRGIKALIVACNTSSALALSEIRAAAGPMPVVGVIRPGVRAAALASRGEPIGVIATSATVSSGAYARELRSALPRTRVVSVACPLFVPLAEEGVWNGRAIGDIARRYLAPIRRARARTLILGCTHYPLLKSAIRGAAGPRVRLIDSGEEAAREAQELLERLGLRRPGGPRGYKRFFVSDDPVRFSRLAERFLGHKIKRARLHVRG